jgi:hypothetical protein
MQGRIAELFTKTESTGLKNQITMRLLFKGVVSPDLTGGVALVIPALRCTLAPLPSLNSTNGRKKNPTNEAEDKGGGRNCAGEAMT